MMRSCSGLNGGDDVIPRRRAPRQGMHEAPRLRTLGTRGVEEFVLQGSHAPPGRNMAPTHDAASGSADVAW